jgi:hypothetical protein
MADSQSQSMSKRNTTDLVFPGGDLPSGPLRNCGGTRAELRVVKREPGCKLVVSVLNLPDPEPGPKRRPLYGPIPWSWRLPASRLPGKSLEVGAVCWLLAGWNRSAEFELALDDRAEFGLSRFSASRGLDTLEWVGLVSAMRVPGRSPVVLILDATVGNP